LELIDGKQWCLGKNMMKDIFEIIKRKIETNYEHRETIIYLSRQVLMSSKKLIYKLHKNELQNSYRILKENEKKIKEMQDIIKKNSKASTGQYNSALQEYAESYTYYYFIKNKELKKPKLVDVENYFLGLCDLTGELCRRAVHAVIKKDMKEIEEIYFFVDEIFRHTLDIELRNGELRKKAGFN